MVVIWMSFYRFTFRVQVQKNILIPISPGDGRSWELELGQNTLEMVSSTSLIFAFEHGVDQTFSRTPPPPLPCRCSKQQGVVGLPSWWDRLWKWVLHRYMRKERHCFPTQEAPSPASPQSAPPKDSGCQHSPDESLASLWSLFSYPPCHEKLKVFTTMAG